MTVGAKSREYVEWCKISQQSPIIFDEWWQSMEPRVIVMEDNTMQTDDTAPLCEQCESQSV